MHIRQRERERERERAAAVIIALNDSENLNKISVNSALRLFKGKDMKKIESVKAVFLKRILCVSTYTP